MRTTGQPRAVDGKTPDGKDPSFATSLTTNFDIVRSVSH